MLEAVRELAEGEIVYMDYGAASSAAQEAGEKLDSQVLLDYGAFDASSNQARLACTTPVPCQWRSSGRGHYMQATSRAAPPMHKAFQCPSTTQAAGRS